MRVLVVEDESDVRDAMVNALRRAGFAVDQVSDWGRADVNLSVSEYDCLVLDRLLPEGDSTGQLAHRRRAGLDVPALMLSAPAEERDRLAGFRAGADDFVAKPFSTAELILRVRALCRRRRQTLPAVTVLRDLTVDTARREVWRAGVPLTLTPKEFAVLELLLHRHPGVASRTDLIEHCWDEQADPMSNVVDVIIGQLRRKLGDPPMINTVRGTGFRLS
jgi:DNA-binding response OmpR family regulator